MRVLRPLFFVVLGILLAGGVARAIGGLTMDNIIPKVWGYPDIANSPAKVACSTTSARTATSVAPYTMVRAFCTVDAFLKPGDTSVTATTSDLPVTAKVPEVINVGNNARVACILSAGTGDCYFHVLK